MPIFPLASQALCLLLLLAAPSATAATIWTGPSIGFTKDDFADPLDPANRDVLVPGVVELSRNVNQGLVNYAQESFFTFGLSPVDTEWAFVNNNPLVPAGLISASNWVSLEFDDWVSANGAQPLDTLGQPAVLHIISEDIYLDVTFTSWTSSSMGGGFSYTRSTPVPEPTSAFLVALGLLGLARHRRH